MPYTALVNLTIHDRRMSSAILCRMVELEHPVIVGEKLGFAGMHDDFWDGEIVEKVTEVETGVTHLVLEDWMSERLTLDEMIGELGPRWTVRHRAA